MLALVLRPFSVALTPLTPMELSYPLVQSWPHNRHFPRPQTLQDKEAFLAWVHSCVDALTCRG